MKHFPLSASFAAAVAFALAGCSSGSSPVGTDTDAGSDAGEHHSSTGSSATGTSTSGSSTTSTSSTTMSGSGCTGDQATFTSLTSGPIKCTQDSDCCVIVNDCTNTAQIVSAANETAAAAAWPSCQNECNGCIPPAVNVFCTNAGVCGGTVISDFVDGGQNLLTSHCGGTPGTAASTMSFGCGS